MRRPAPRTKPRIAQAASFAAATSGWIANANLAAANAKLQGAFKLQNFFPLTTSIILRRGSVRYATLGNGTLPVDALMAYKNGNQNNLFGASRGKQSADILLMSNEHYAAYDGALVALQRITERSGSAGMNAIGFNNLAYIGAGREVSVVMGGGIGSAIPANTTFGLNSDSLRLRVNPLRRMGSKLFSGDGQMPINQDAIAQFMGFMGELTMTNPLFNWRLFDSSPAA